MSIESLHKQLPDYAVTPLRPLPALAAELGLGQVLLKDESNRFGMPSFKILGASWAAYQALRKVVRLPQTATLSELADALKGRTDIRILTTTEGNWGRALARMAKYLGNVPCRIYVPELMPEDTREKLRSEGAEVIPVAGGNYDDCIAIIQREAAEADPKPVLMLDVGWEGFEDVPQWVVEGYGTMLVETDSQVLEITDGKTATHVIVPVGAGSIAEAVTKHYKSPPSGSKVIAVEPDTAACLRESVAAGKSITVRTGETIMCGLNCGTLSNTAWPILQAGVDYCSTVTDLEAHKSVEKLKTQNVLAGPCGAASLVALKKVIIEAKDKLGLGKDSVVVLFCTEGPRDYEVEEKEES